MFDRDYPGMYLRQIENVTLSVPCVTGPYTGVHCRLTLLSSETRIDPRLDPPPHRCCAEGDHREPGHCGCDQRERDQEHRYELCPDDPRAVRQHGAVEAIATSSGQADSGMFEVSFRDERYLPFEYAGAVSRWRIELPQRDNEFDLDTLADVVLHLNFTAREGGELLRRSASDAAQRHLPGGGIRFFDIRHEFPDAWAMLRGDTAGRPGRRQLALRMGREMFPFLPGRHAVRIRRLDLFFEAPGADPGESRWVEFLVGHRPGHVGHLGDEDCDCQRLRVECAASDEWPCLFHGVFDAELPPLTGEQAADVGTFEFAPSVREVSRAFLFCGYTVARGCEETGHGG
jgi:hypothetical protein